MFDHLRETILPVFPKKQMFDHFCDFLSRFWTVPYHARLQTLALWSFLGFIIQISWSGILGGLKSENKNSDSRYGHHFRTCHSPMSIGQTTAGSSITFSNMKMVPTIHPIICPSRTKYEPERTQATTCELKLLKMVWVTLDRKALTVWVCLEPCVSATHPLAQAGLPS